MKKNMGILDRMIRLVIAGVLIYLAATDKVTGGWGIAVWIVGIIFMLTAMTGNCPLYKACGIRTSSKKEFKESKTGA